MKARKRKYISMHAYAKRNGVAPSTIHKHVKKKKIALSKEGLIWEDQPFVKGKAGRPQTVVYK